MIIGIPPEKRVLESKISDKEEFILPIDPILFLHEQNAYKSYSTVEISYNESAVIKIKEVICEEPQR